MYGTLNTYTYDANKCKCMDIAWGVGDVNIMTGRPNKFLKRFCLLDGEFYCLAAKMTTFATIDCLSPDSYSH